jgi:hypothetical protein
MPLRYLLLPWCRKYFQKSFARSHWHVGCSGLLPMFAQPYSSPCEIFRFSCEITSDSNVRQLVVVVHFAPDFLSLKRETKARGRAPQVSPIFSLYLLYSTAREFESSRVREFESSRVRERVCVCVCVRERERERSETNTLPRIPSTPPQTHSSTPHYSLQPQTQQHYTTHQKR